MRSLVFLATTLLGLTVSTYASYEWLRPKTIAQHLSWKGYRIINTENGWQAAYTENSNVFTSVQALRRYCFKSLEDVSEKELLESVKYCTDVPRTVRGYFIKEGLINDLMSDKDQYEISFAIRKENKHFLDLISYSEGKDIFLTYKEWCESNLNKDLSAALISNVKIFCTPKKYRTADEKLKHDGLVRLNKEQLRAKFKDLRLNKLKNNQSNTLLNDIAKNGNWAELKKDKDPKQDKFVDAYWDYCEREGKKSISEKGFYLEGYAKFKSRCADVSEIKETLKKVEEIQKSNPLVKKVLDFEKANECSIYFIHNRENNINYRVDDPIWLEIEKEEEFEDRDLYEEFASFTEDPKSIELCKKNKGRKIYVVNNWKNKKWG